MKKEKFLRQLHELKSGKLEGGFAVLQTTSNVIVVGGTLDPTNNCVQGGCPITNNCSGGNCGNCAAGCGVKN